MVTHTVPVTLPEENSTPYATTSENIQLSVNKNGDFFWDESHIASADILLARLKVEAEKRPQPEVHIRGDQLTHFKSIDEVINLTKQAGIGKIAFVTTPSAAP